VSEHVAFVRSGGREIGHLTALPLCREAIVVVARNVDRARRHLPDIPLLLENVAWSFRWPEAEMSEGEFYSELQSRTACELLLDVGNLFANAVNSQADPLAWVDAFPLEHVGMIHIRDSKSVRPSYAPNKTRSRALSPTWVPFPRALPRALVKSG
jgi:uncharacterized protein (UPF0276 family)